MQTIWADKLNEPRAWMAGAACWATGSCCDRSRAGGRPVAVVADQHYAETARGCATASWGSKPFEQTFWIQEKGCPGPAGEEQSESRNVSELCGLQACEAAELWSKTRNESRIWSDVDWVDEVSERHAVGCSIFDCRRIEIGAPKQSHWEMFRTLDRPI